MKAVYLESANQRMKVNRDQLDNLLRENVCEIKFVRRIPVPGLPSTCRMLCTKSYDLLTSPNGRRILRYRPPSTSFRIDEDKYKLCTVWDIFMCDYRNVSIDACWVITTIPANDEFWAYFNERLLTMTGEQKLEFRNV